MKVSLGDGFQFSNRLSYRGLQAALAVVIFCAPAAWSAECVKIELSDAEKCEDLKVKADLSACEDQTIGEPELNCSGKRSEVTIRGSQAEYIVRLKQGGGAWAKGWETGSVRKIILAAKSSSHKKSKSEKSQAKKKEAPTALEHKEASHESSAETSRVLASSEEKAPAAPASTPSGFQFSAYFDAYYAYNFNKPAAVTAPASTTAQSAMIPSGQNNLHFYDWYSNQLGLNLAELTIKHQRKETSFVLDLDFGQMADINAQVPVTATSGGPTSATVDEVSKHIGQAVMTYTPSAAPGLVVEAGKMATHVGLELIKAKDNWNYTRGALFSFGGPFWHTGFHVGYAVVPDRFTANVYLYQGWNTIYENNSSPTLGAQLKWTPSSEVTWIYNYIGGPEQARNNRNKKQVHETNVTYSPSSKVSLAADFLLGNEKQATVGTTTADADWFGFALLAKIQVTQRYSLAPRFEIYRDYDGYTLGGNAQNLYTYTLTQSLQVSEGFESRLEYRWDHSTAQNRFIKGNETSRNQSVLLLSFLYSMN